MGILSILLFFIYTYGLGFTATAFLKNSENFLERTLMRVGLGIGVFIVLTIFLNFLHIPLHWWLILLLSIAYPLFWLARNSSKIDLNLKLTKSNIFILVVLLLFAFSLYMYAGGAFSYPWLEDDDPWLHAVGSKYIALERTAYTPLPGEKLFAYMDPYPPSYDILMGVLHQTNDSINWTLKFFNALIISLGVIFFYFFAKLFTKSAKKALFATFVLTVIPSYLSHFIWSHALVPTLYFPTFYALLMIGKDKRWVYPASILTASLLLLAPTQTVKFGLFFIIFVGVKMLLEKRLLMYEIAAGAAGLLLSMLWWVPAMIRWGGFSTVAALTGGVEMKGGVITGERTLSSVLKHVFNPLSGSATRPYSFNDFFVAKSQNMINNPVGWGIFITILVAVALIGCIIFFNRYIKQKKWIIITLALFAYTFLGVHGARLPFGLIAFRFWMLLAIPTSLLAAEGAWLLAGTAKRLKIAPWLVFAVLLLGLFFTSGIQKYNINTSIWLASQIDPNEALQGRGHVWLTTLPPNTKVFSFISDSSVGTSFIIGFDKYSCDWCTNVIEFRDGIAQRSPEEIHSFLKRNDYEYVVVDFKFARNAGTNVTNQKIQEMLQSGLFAPAHQGAGVIVMRVG